MYFKALPKPWVMTDRGPAVARIMGNDEWDEESYGNTNPQPMKIGGMLFRIGKLCVWPSRRINQEDSDPMLRLPVGHYLIDSDSWAPVPWSLEVQELDDIVGLVQECCYD